MHKPPTYCNKERTLLLASSGGNNMTHLWMDPLAPRVCSGDEVILARAECLLLASCCKMHWPSHYDARTFKVPEGAVKYLSILCMLVLRDYLFLSHVYSRFSAL